MTESQFVADLLKQHPGALIDHNTGGGCESCGWGSQRTRCLICDVETREYLSQYIGYGTEAFPHREGCSVPLILKAQHEAGLHT